MTGEVPSDREGFPPPSTDGRLALSPDPGRQARFARLRAAGVVLHPEQVRRATDVQLGQILDRPDVPDHVRELAVRTLVNRARNKARRAGIFPPPVAHTVRDHLHDCQD